MHILLNYFQKIHFYFFFIFEKKLFNRNYIFSFKYPTFLLFKKQINYFKNVNKNITLYVS